MFMALDARGEERLIIFGADAGSKTGQFGRMAAERLVNELVQEKLRDDGGRGGGPLQQPVALAAQAVALAQAGGLAPQALANPQAPLALAQAPLAL
eukprot:CAMPEP_0168441100 /NCGR_PEP_ID=MMETSP0228-20121227/43314_1 /TAXON_ID=133427 /ORGANISM="Protoceratium reticulatum, Strain CCCM 535 (=CCMP 1889)" /LENGTH=95 /DNA_ID=CAMNT_0008455411 /DNA_START=18 /DNA_END=300 /DNA_ORIENTATION=-